MHRWEKVTQDICFSESCRTVQGSRQTKREVLPEQPAEGRFIGRLLSRAGGSR